MMEGQGDLFNDLVPPARNEEPAAHAPLEREDLLRTAFVLSNVLLNVLIEKGIITEAESNDLLGAALKEYQKKVKLNENS